MRNLRILGILLAFGGTFAMAQPAWETADWPKTDFSRRTVDLHEIEAGGPHRGVEPAAVTSGSCVSADPRRTATSRTAALGNCPSRQTGHGSFRRHG